MSGKRPGAVNSFEYLSFFARTNKNHGGFFPGRLHIHRDCSHPMGCETEQRSVGPTISELTVLIVFWSIGRRFLIATTGIISGRSVVERVVGMSPGSGKDASI